MPRLMAKRRLMMSNDIITTNQLPETTQVSLLEIRMDAKRYPRLHTYPREKAVMEMSKVVTQAFLYKGQAADPTNIQFISCSLVDELQADLDKTGTNYVTFAEISRVVKRAVLCDDMYGISVASLYRVIIDYVKGEGHRLSLEARKRKEEDDRESIKRSVIAPMLQAYAGQLIRKSKV